MRRKVAENVKNVQLTSSLNNLNQISICDSGLQHNWQTHDFLKIPNRIQLDTDTEHETVSPMVVSHPDIFAFEELQVLKTTQETAGSVSHNTCLNDNNSLILQKLKNGHVIIN